MDRLKKYNCFMLKTR